MWRTGETLWTHSVAHGGDALAHLNLAMSLPDRRDPRVKAHLEEAVRMEPAFVLANLNLGLNMDLNPKLVEKIKGDLNITQAAKESDE